MLPNTTNFTDKDIHAQNTSSMKKKHKCNNKKLLISIDLTCIQQFLDKIKSYLNMSNF